MQSIRPPPTENRVKPKVLTMFVEGIYEMLGCSRHKKTKIHQGSRPPNKPVLTKQKNTYLKGLGLYLWIPCLLARCISAKKTCPRTFTILATLTLRLKELGNDSTFQESEALFINILYTVNKKKPAIEIKSGR